MTQPGGGNNVNLAALWIPVMPETSHMGEEMRKAGQQAKQQFEQGFNSGASPESLGQSFGNKFSSSLSQQFKHFELPYGLGGFFEKFESDVDQKLVGKLKNEATQAMQQYRGEYEKYNSILAQTKQVEESIAAQRSRGAQPFLADVQRANQLHTQLNATYSQAQQSLGTYNNKTREMNGELSKTADMGNVVAGIMGGAVVLAAGAAVKGIEGLVEVTIEGFAKAIEVTKELATQAVELGETYEGIGIQIHEFSSATGEDFERMESAAQNIFGTLDVAGQNVGQTMAQLSSMMGVQGEDITTLVRNLTELQGRYTSLKAADLGSIFFAFNTSAEQADSALASLLQSARSSGQDFGTFTAALSGDTAITLHEAGLSLEQAGAFMGELLKLGPQGRSVVMGLQSAMKEFGKEGLSFSDGMVIAEKRLQELGDTPAGQDLAQKLFGTSRWAVAMRAVEEYVNVVNKTPESYQAASDSVDQFLNETKTLGNEIEEFKHKAEDTFKPFGEAAKNAVAHGLDLVSAWFTKNHTQIIAKIGEWGDKLIDSLPTIQAWVSTAIRMTGDFTSFLLYAFTPVATTLAAAGAGMLALSGHFDEAGKLLTTVANFDPMKISDMANTVADKIDGMKLDTEKIKDYWDNIVDSANSMPATAGASLPQQGSFFNPGGPGSSSGPGGPGSAAPGFPSQGGPGSSTKPGGPGGIFGGAPGTSGPGTTESNMALAQQLFPWGQDEWNAFYQLEMKEAGFNSTAKNPSSGAFGMGQFLGHENDQYAAGYSTDPATQLTTMFQYIKDRYGTPSAAWAQYYQHPNGQGYYATGGSVPEKGFTDVVIDPGNPIQPGDYSSLQEYLHAINLSSFLGAANAAAEHHDTGGEVGGGAAHLGGFGPEDFGSLEEYRKHAMLMAQIAHIEQMGYATGGSVKDAYWDNTSFGMGDNGTPRIMPSQIGTSTPIGQGVSGNLPSRTSAYEQWMRAMVGIPVGSEGGRFPLWWSYGLDKPMQAPFGFGVPTGDGGTHFAKGGGPRGTDTVPAWLTPGEYVWDLQTMDKWGWLIHSLRKDARGFQGGGPVDDVVGTNGNIQAVDGIAKGFQLQLTAGKSGHGTHDIDGKWHDSGAAGDFSNGDANTPEMLAFAMYMFEHYGSSLAELIYSDPRMTKLIKDGKVVDPSFYGADTLAGHTNHVHIAIRPETQVTDMSPGNEALTQGLNMSAVSPGAPGSTPRGGPALPGVPGQYGGFGAYGAQTYDERVNADQAVAEANDRASDLDYQINENRSRLEDLKKELENVYVSDKLSVLTGKPLPLTPEEKIAADKRKEQLEKQIAAEEHQLDVNTRERGEQDGKIDEAKRKQLESYYKVPKREQHREASGTEAFGQFGGAFLSGIAQELGFGDILDKPPWEWGAVKLATGLASWGLGTANAWADEIGKGHTGVTGFAAMPGYDNDQGWGGAADAGQSGLSGLLSGMGLNLPKPKNNGVSSGPNVVQTQPGPGFGAAPGPAPGPPVIGGDYMPINVQAGVNPSTILAPVQEQRNAQNSQHFQHDGGFPPR